MYSEELYWIYVLFFTGLLVFATLSKNDFFPFSHYPMFSKISKAESICIFRLKLKTTEGELRWWKPKFYRYPEVINKKLQVLYHLQSQSLGGKIFFHEQRRILNEALQIIENEEHSLLKYEAIHIIKMTVNENLEIVEQTMDIIEVKPIKNADVI